jgi:hypothetical protein
VLEGPHEGAEEREPGKLRRARCAVGMGGGGEGGDGEEAGGKRGEKTGGGWKRGKKQETKHGQEWSPCVTLMDTHQVEGVGCRV